MTLPVNFNSFKPFVKEDKYSQTQSIHYVNPAVISDIYQTKTADNSVQKLTLKTTDGLEKDIFVKGKIGEVFEEITGTPMEKKKYLNLSNPQNDKN